MNLRDELMAVRDRFGALTPANLVDAARDADSPLHSRFEWDDSTAAEKFRRVQAAELIRSVKVSYADVRDRPQEVRAFLPVRGVDSPASVYEPTELLLADPFTAKMKLQEFEREWKAFKAKYEHMKEFASIIARDIAA